MKQQTLFEKQHAWHLDQVDMLIKQHNDAIENLKVIRQLIENPGAMEPEEEHVYDVSLTDAALYLKLTEASVLRIANTLTYKKDAKGICWFSKNALEKFKMSYKTRGVQQNRKRVKSVAKWEKKITKI